MPWEILEEVLMLEPRKKQGAKSSRRRFYRVRCSCGYEGHRRADWVDDGRSIECKVCASKRTARVHGMPSSFRGVGGLSMTHFSSIKHGAVRRGVPFDITIDFAWDLFKKQQGVCALSGELLVLEAKIRNSSVDWGIITASLDRIDSSKGYTEDNVWWVHKDYNRFKNNYTMDKFLEMCRKVHEKHNHPNSTY